MLAWAFVGARGLLLHPHALRHAHVWAPARMPCWHARTLHPPARVCAGNVTERGRMGRLHGSGQVVVDLYAGVGYYTLPLLVNARVHKVRGAVQWPHTPPMPALGARDQCAHLPAAGSVLEHLRARVPSPRVPLSASATPHQQAPCVRPPRRPPGPAPTLAVQQRPLTSFPAARTRRRRCTHASGTRTLWRRCGAGWWPMAWHTGTRALGPCKAACTAAVPVQGCAATLGCIWRLRAFACALLLARLCLHSPPVCSTARLRPSPAPRCKVLPGDCTQVAPVAVADRVMLGLLPSSEQGWPAAVAALRRDTGTRSGGVGARGRAGGVLGLLLQARPAAVDTLASSSTPCACCALLPQAAGCTCTATCSTRTRRGGRSTCWPACRTWPAPWPPPAAPPLRGARGPRGCTAQRLPALPPRLRTPPQQRLHRQSPPPPLLPPPRAPPLPLPPPPARRACTCQPAAPPTLQSKSGAVRAQQEPRPGGLCCGMWSGCVHGTAAQVAPTLLQRHVGCCCCNW